MSMYRTLVHSSNVCSIKSRFSVKKCFSFHIGSYANLESIKIGLLVVSYFWNDKSYKKYVAIPQTGIFQRNSIENIAYNSEFWSILALFIASSRARSNVVDKMHARNNLRNLRKETMKIGLNHKCVFWPYFDFLISWTR